MKYGKRATVFRQVITRVEVINLYPDGADRKKAVSDAKKAKQSLLVAIGAYDTARRRMERSQFGHLQSRLLWCALHGSACL